MKHNGLMAQVIGALLYKLIKKQKKHIFKILESSDARQINAGCSNLFILSIHY